MGEFVYLQQVKPLFPCLTLEKFYGMPKSTISRAIKYMVDFLWQRNHHQLDRIDQPWLLVSYLTLKGIFYFSGHQPLTVIPGQKDDS